MERAELIEVVRHSGCAVERAGRIFLTDPKWSESDRAHVARVQSAVEASGAGLGGERGWLGIPTGGTRGGLRFARHDENTLSAAVRGFVDFFGLERINAVDVLPPYHVSGFMSRVRCAATGGRHVTMEWRRLEAGERPDLDAGAGPWVISLVPTQLQRLLSSVDATAWLRRFEVVFVGGGPSWPSLTDQAAAAQIRVALTYGMTETAAMVAAISPTDFLAGERTGATVMPHARIELGPDATVIVEGTSVFRGYFPDFETARRFQTDDVGQWDDRGRLRILGRKDAVIITGGKKVQPLEVEAALQATGQFVDVAVLGMPDPTWGEAVVACYPRGETTGPNLSVVERGVESTLAPHKRPKRYVAISDWPRNAQGKLSRPELARRIAQIEAGASGT